MHTTFSGVLLNTVLILVLIWFVVLVVSLVSLYRRKDIFKVVKYLWAAIIFFAPVGGLLIYLIYGPKKRIQ